VSALAALLSPRSTPRQVAGDDTFTRYSLNTDPHRGPSACAHLRFSRNPRPLGAGFDGDHPTPLATPCQPFGQKIQCDACHRTHVRSPPRAQPHPDTRMRMRTILIPSLGSVLARWPIRMLVVCNHCAHNHCSLQPLQTISRIRTLANHYQHPTPGVYRPPTPTRTV
jgi:hypothetical protein